MFDDTNVTINTESERVIIMDLQYLQKLPKLLATTPFATIGKYIRIYYIHTYINHFTVKLYTSPLIIRIVSSVIDNQLLKCFSAIRMVERLFGDCSINVTAIS